MKHFFIRKVLLVKYSYAFVVMPGGFGTMDEYFETLTLIQTRKIKDFPVIIFCKDFHKELLEHIDLMYTQGAISDPHRRLYLVTDSIQEAIDLIKERCINRYKLVARKPVSTLRLLFERKW